tara:strand:+ start:123814 stop:124137 length:324 start_codon:yes stop_codon:yes gene_type:complete
MREERTYIDPSTLKADAKPFSPEQALKAHSSSVSRVTEAVNDALAQHYDGTGSVTVALTMHRHAGEKVINTVIERYKKAGWTVEYVQAAPGWQDKGIGAPSLIFTKK